MSRICRDLWGGIV